MEDAVQPTKWAPLVTVDRDFGPEDYSRALINILEDFTVERLRLRENQAAVINILDDFGAEKDHLQRVQKAMFNIFDDLHEERSRLETAKAELVLFGQQVQASLREKEVLLQEVHHRVKNNLQVISSLINMQVRKLRDDSSRAALAECQNRVLAIALIHEKLYQSRNYARIPFSDYARSLAASIFHAGGVSPEHLALNVEVESVSLAVDKAIPCGLILNELITNSLKHAFPNERRGTIKVRLRRSGCKVELEVADDGVGMKPGFAIATSDSLGMQLVLTLVEQLGGDLTISCEQGAAFRIQFPVEASE